MRTVWFVGCSVVSLLTTLSLAVACPPDSVQVGTVCVDQYEASVWNIDPERKKLLKKVQRGTATPTNLTDGQAAQLGYEGDDYDLAGCPDTGNGCTSIYAVAIPGVRPARFLTWFQAAAACRNAGKRLLTNAEWQMAALGTPDPGAGGDGITTCNTTAVGPVATGTAGNCISDVGAFDMVGNVWEWVADWMQGDTNPWAPASGSTNPTYGDDLINGINPAQTQGNGQGFPAALERGGGFRFGNSTSAGVFALSAAQGPSAAFDDLGFRCGR